MARKYVAVGTPDAEGMRDMTVEQVENRNKANETTRQIVYRTFGEEKDSPLLFAKKVAALATAAAKDPAALATLTDWYGQWVYGVDLDARQENKTGGPAGTVVTLSKTEECEMVSGEVISRATGAKTGRVIALADRVEALNGVLTKARMAGSAMPRQAEEIIAGWTAAGVATLDGGRVVLAPAGKNGPQGAAPTKK